MDSDLIIPPDELKLVIDKTAEFVAARGKQAEDMIMKKEADNPNFSFLKDEDDVFRIYY
jgi:hypothetical protein